jgi:translation initiation factor 2 beta subunit (eIF-2beta)/eIF-5
MTTRATAYLVRICACGATDTKMVERSPGYWRNECQACGSPGPFQLMPRHVYESRKAGTE